MKLTKEQACQMIRENENFVEGYEPISVQMGWDIEYAVDYLKGCEKCEDGDYPVLIYDISDRVDSCEFDRETREQIDKAIFDLYDQAYLAGELNLAEYLN